MFQFINKSFPILLPFLLQFKDLLEDQFLLFTVLIIFCLSDCISFTRLLVQSFWLIVSLCSSKFINLHLDIFYLKLFIRNHFLFDPRKSIVLKITGEFYSRHLLYFPQLSLPTICTTCLCKL